MNTSNSNQIAKALHTSIAGMASLIAWDVDSYIVLADLFKLLGNVTGDQMEALDDYRSEFEPEVLEVVEIRLSHTKAFQ